MVDRTHNRLLTAAAKITCFLATLHTTPCLPFEEKAMLKRYLLKKLEAFEQQAKRLRCDSEIIFLAKYVLGACLDEAIFKLFHHTKVGWDRNDLVREFHHQFLQDSEHFFVLLQKAVHLPDRFIDLIELMYLCVNLGFTAKVSSSADKMHYLQSSQLMQHTYQIIQRKRGEFDRRLSPAIEKVYLPRESFQKIKKGRVVFGITLLIVFSTLVYLMAASVKL